MPPPHHRASAHGGGWSHGGPGALDLLREALRARGRKGPSPTCTGAHGLLRSSALPGYHDLRRAGGGDGPLSAHHRALPQTLRPYPFPLPAASPPRKSSLQVIIMVTYSITFHQAPSSAPARGRHTGVIGGWAWAYSSSSMAGRPPGVRGCWEHSSGLSPPVRRRRRRVKGRRTWSESRPPLLGVGGSAGRGPLHTARTSMRSGSNAAQLGAPTQHVCLVVRAASRTPGCGRALARFRNPSAFHVS